MLLFVAILFGSYGSCTVGYSSWRANWLSDENPRRQRVLVAFLSEPSNYREKLGGKLSSYRVERNYSDFFVTYTIFECSGEVAAKRIRFTIRVMGGRPYLN